MTVKIVLFKVRDVLSYAALGFLVVMASQQFASPFYLNATPRPWFGFVILGSAIAVAHRLRNMQKHAESEPEEAVRR